MEPQNLLFNLWIDFLNITIRSAKITIDGFEIDKPIHKTTIEGGMVKKYIYLSNEQGLVTRAVLLDGQNRELDAEIMNIEKTGFGQMIVFFYEFDLRKRGVLIG